MSQTQQNITISAPGFGGLNTELSPADAQDSFASVADNCIIDKYGRIAARKGFLTLTTDATAYGADINIEKIYSHLDEVGVETVFTAADNRIFKAEAVPIDITPVAGSTAITDNHWQIVTFNDACYFYQKNHTAMKWDSALATLVEPVTALPRAHVACAAYGRMWVAGVVGESPVIHWSELLNGDNFTTGDSGLLDVTKYWPTGFDTVEAIIAHNDRLIVFGRNNILIYSGADDPVNSLALEDSINGMGCIARDTVHSIGKDILFLDTTGVRSLARTIQERSAPIGDVSRNVRTTLVEFIADTEAPEQIDAVYASEESLYLLLFKENNIIYAFDTRQVGENGEMRVTSWPGNAARSACVSKMGRLLIGGVSRIGLYSGYLDAGASYPLRYFSNPMTFGDVSRLKFPKQIDFTVLAGGGVEATVFWGFNYSNVFRNQPFTLTGLGAVAFYGVSEYGDSGVPLSEYTAGATLARAKVNIGGNGVAVQVGLEVAVGGETFSIQELNIQALIGRMV